MKSAHIAIAVALMIVWGLNFVAIRIGLDHYPPLLFAALRFLVAAIPIAVVGRPAIPLSRLAALAATLFVGQFAFLFSGMQVGFPPGLASLTIQVQAFFTVILTSAVLREIPRARTVAGLVIAFAGLGLVATTVGSNGVTIAGFGLILAAAACWACGNVILRGMAGLEMFAVIVWISALATPPLLLLSLVFEGAAVDLAALARPTITGLAALAFVAVPTTVLGYWLWGELLKRYPAGVVAPLALLVPVTGAVSSWLILGENFGPGRISGMLLILLGLGVNTFPTGKWMARQKSIKA